jgi:hypothetical protein
MGGVGGAIGGAVGGLMGGIGGAQQQKKQNRYNTAAASFLNPDQLNARAGALNPWLMGALGNDPGTSGYQQNLFNIAQNPGYIDPSLMNLPFHLSAQRANQDMNRAQGILGRTMGGQGVSGLGNAYALANQAGRTARDVGTAQQYSLFREQQRRADLGFIQQQLMGLLGMAGGQAGQAGQFWAGQQAPMNAMQIGSNMIQGGMGGMAGKAQPGMPMATPTRNMSPNTGGPVSASQLGNVPGAFGGQPNAWQGMGLMGGR